MCFIHPCGATGVVSAVRTRLVFDRLCESAVRSMRGRYLCDLDRSGALVRGETIMVPIIAIVMTIIRFRVQTKPRSTREFARFCFHSPPCETRPLKHVFCSPLVDASLPQSVCTSCASGTYAASPGARVCIACALGQARRPETSR